MEEPKREPSIFLGTLLGYGVATVITAIVIVVLSAQAGQVSATGSYQALGGAALVGATVGYSITVRRRKALGIASPLDEWRNFVSSPAFFLIAALAIIGSFALAFLIKAVVGALAEGGL
jgi:hypothetical protein